VRIVGKKEKREVNFRKKSKKEKKRRIWRMGGGVKRKRNVKITRKNVCLFILVFLKYQR